MYRLLAGQLPFFPTKKVSTGLNIMNLLKSQAYSVLFYLILVVLVVTKQIRKHIEHTHYIPYLEFQT